MQRQVSQLLVRLTLAVLAVGILVASAVRAEPLQAEKPVPVQRTEGNADDDHRREVERMVSGIEVEALIDGQWIKVKRIDKPLLYHDDPTRKHTRGSLWG